MRLNPFAIDRLTPMPWKNGGGSTREVVIQPLAAGLDDFDWRVSVATIANDGPFSAFAGIDRTILLLSGDGVQLTSDDGAIDHRLDQAWVPFTFAGEARIDCRLLGGPSTDFNVMSRRDRISARFDVLTGARANPAAISEGLVLAVRGDWRIGASGPPGSADAGIGSGVVARFGEGRGFWWAAPSAGSVAGQGAAPIIDLQADRDDACLLRLAIDRHLLPVRPL